MGNKPKKDEIIGLQGLKWENLKFDSSIHEPEQLPFVATNKKANRFWDCKSTGIPDEPGVYTADCDLGVEYGRLYLSYLINNQKPAFPLTWIVSEMNNLDDDRKGISVGFLWALESFAKIGAQYVQFKQKREKGVRAI
jgi:hypothetical protein